MDLGGVKRLANSGGGGGGYLRFWGWVVEQAVSRGTEIRGTLTIGHGLRLSGDMTMTRGSETINSVYTGI